MRNSEVVVLSHGSYKVIFDYDGSISRRGIIALDANGEVVRGGKYISPQQENEIANAVCANFSCDYHKPVEWDEAY